MLQLPGGIGRVMSEARIMLINRGVCLKCWYPQNTHPKCWSFLVGPKARVVGETPTIFRKALYFCWEERGRSLSCQGSSGTVCGGNWLPWFPPSKGDLSECVTGEFLSASPDFPSVHPEMGRPEAYHIFSSSSKITVKCIPYIPMYPKNRGFKGRFLLGQQHLLGLQSGHKLPW